MKTYFTFFLLLIINVGFAQVTNVKTGSWNDPTVWSNSLVPTDTTNVILNYDVIVDANDSCRSLNTNGHKVNVTTGIILQIKGGNVFDVDGNLYNTVDICTQVWMAKNLTVSHYRNGDSIPEVENGTVWSGLTTGAWCYYKGDTANGRKYGKLYNWYAVNDPRGLAPAGWHIPNDSEWTVLTKCLGGSAGGKMKETGTTHWLSPNTGATNSSGFTALPGGNLAVGFIFFDINEYAYWWSTTDANPSPWFYTLSYETANVQRSNPFPKGDGLSIRCVKD
jgi:uncharacterized protein (TIGR02145 family)